MTQTKGFLSLFSLSDQCAGRGEHCILQGKFSCILLNLPDLPPLLSSSAILVLSAKNGRGQTKKRLLDQQITQRNEPVLDHLETVPSLQKSLQSPHEDAALSSVQSLKALLMWTRLRAVGRKSHLLITSAQRSVSLVIALEGCEASSLKAFVECFITCWQTWAPNSFWYWTKWKQCDIQIPVSSESKECVLSYRMVLIKLWLSQNCSNYTINAYRINTWKLRQGNICFVGFIFSTSL